MSKLYLLVLLTVLPVLIFSQNVFKKKVGICNTSMFHLETDSVFANADCHKLLDDICNNLSPKHYKKLKGEIFMQVLIDTAGVPCVFSIEDNLNYSAEEVGLIQIKS
jgi:hypothetical protein